MSKPKRLAEPGKRHRRDNGPQALEITPKAPPSLKSQGTLHVHTTAIIQGGPEALLATDKNAQTLAREFGEAFGDDLKAQWTFETPWIKSLLALPSDTTGEASPASFEAYGFILPDDAKYKQDRVNRARERGIYAMQWRPTFLATVALAHSITIGAKAAGVGRQTVINHRELDPDFDAQVIAAQNHCIELLHSVTMRDAIEGIIEPIYWQGIEVGHVRKVDNRLRIEMLRAHMPTTFKTPGSRVNVNTGNQLIFGGGQPVDAQAIQDLMAMRQVSLDRIIEKKAQALEVGTSLALPVPNTP